MALATTSVSGLISGLDSASIIQQLMSIERRPISLLQIQINEAEAKKQAFTTINTSLLALKTAVDELATEAAWTSKSTAVSDESVLSATATSATPEGAYTFKVTQLAEATQLASNGYADPDTTAVGAGSFDITVAGVLESITVSATDTLDDVAAAINAKDMGASAMVVNTGSGANPYKLFITSDETGTDNGTTITNNTSGLTLTELTGARNATIEFGKDSPITVESATNTVTGLAPGLTLDLKATSADPVTVTVSLDTAGIIEKARDFMAKYNQVHSDIDRYTDYDEDAEQAAILLGNTTLRFISSDLARAAGDKVDGVAEEVNSLTMVGFTLGTDGELALDEDVFTDALEAHTDDVAELFSAVFDRAMTTAGASFSASPAAAGGFDVNDIINGNTGEDDFGSGNGFESLNPIGGGDVFVMDFGATRQISQLFLYTPGGGQGISDFKVEIQRPGGAWEEMKDVSGFSGTIWAHVLTDPLAATGMRVTVTGTNAPDGKTRLLELKAKEEAGAAHRISNQLAFLTRGTDGAIATEQTALDDRIGGMEDQIADLEARLLVKEERLRNEFIAMEQALAQMQSQSNFFLTQLSAMNSSNSGSGQ